MFCVCVLCMGVHRVYVCVCVRACMHVKEPELGVPVLCTQILPFLHLIGELFTPSRFATVFCYSSAICRQLCTDAAIPVLAIPVRVMYRWCL